MASLSPPQMTLDRHESNELMAFRIPLSSDVTAILLLARSPFSHGLFVSDAAAAAITELVSCMNPVAEAALGSVFWFHCHNSPPSEAEKSREGCVRWKANSVMACSCAFR